MRTSRRLRLRGDSSTVALSERLAADVRAGDLILLSGDLGAGKSTFARGFIRALTHPDEEVPSPTFTLVQSYQDARGRSIHHFDLYRLSGPGDLEEIGFHEAIRDGIALVEWPERLGAARPDEWIEVALAFCDRQDERDAVLTATLAVADRIAFIAPAGDDSRIKQ